jgi:hypothetical protein
MIRQFDVFANPSRIGSEERPYVVSIQSPFWNEIATRICVPLIDERFIRPQGRLNPRIALGPRILYFHPLEVFTLPTRLLRKPIANLGDYSYQIVAALDLMFTGI